MRALTALVLATLVCQPATADDGDLEIVVLQGEGATSSAAGRRGAPISILVQDRDKKPVGGAIVNALMPALGAGGSFAHGDSFATRHTGDDGKVHFANFHLRPVPGEFPVRIVAYHQNRSAHAIVTQRVNDEPSAPRARRFSRRTIAILAIAGAGVAAGVVAAAHQADPPRTPTSFSVTPGSPTLTGPR